VGVGKGEASKMAGKGKVALITGGGRGIGRAICLAMARTGIRVAVNDVKKDTADEVVKQIGKEGRIASSFQTDIRHENEIKSMVEKVLDAFGRIDFLINNAGIPDQLVPVIEQNSHKWQDVIDIHLRGTYLCSKEIATGMIKNNFGRIVNISSIVGLNGFPMRTAYGPAKSAIIMLTKVLAIEWASFNINVNAIAPGFIRTEMVEDLIRMGKLNEEKICNRIPLKRLGTSEEIANIVLFLCSEAASYITGETIVVDGGWVAYGYI
jgi:NAD(P)-dependent dehydrogenase (short-subunit alcohol dehydrogenase family)